MENVFLDLLYQKEFKSKLIDRIKNYFRYRKLIRKLKKNPPSFDTLWQFAEYIKWADFIYGLDSTNTDIDLLKKRNSYINLQEKLSKFRLLYYQMIEPKFILN